MSFVSFSFLLFLPIVFSLYWTLAKRLFWQNTLIVAASYVFYGWWDVRFLLLIFLTTLSSYVSGRMIDSAQSKSVRTWTATANIVFNLLILATFKYFNFFASSLQTWASSLGFLVDMPTLNVILPVGISFYTFQSLSYTIAVYRCKIRATQDVMAFFAFICFFPQLVAGPIERATNLLPQMLRCRRFDYAEAVDGLRQMLWGFFKKMVVADNCALAVNQVWDNWQGEGGVMLIVGMLLFTFQIYGDFSGYSDIAIGTARLFGIRLNENFRLPYFSRTVGEFWRRWHISLMSWFRDYVYIPLGGSRRGRLITVCNTFIVFLLSGLWHGANWTFVLWGVYHALLFLPFLLLGRKMAKDSSVPSFADVPSIMLTFLLVVVGWVFFRADSIGAAFGYLWQTATTAVNGEWGTVHAGKVAILWCILLITVEWLQRDKCHALQWPPRCPACVRWTTYYLLVLAIVFFHGEDQVFIYFQF
jgi:D-alanyl-lipoteichoic acid acyltransferase DltB (MBOAT superfamily)